MKSIIEGWMPFKEKYHTYYRIVGEPSDKPPLILLHGGPGSTHNYFEGFDDFAGQDGRQVIMYDQIGCGRSSIPDDPSMFCLDVWVQEFKQLIKYLKLQDIHILGQSWGGMLAISYVCDCDHRGVKSVILASTLSNSQLWGKEQHRLISFMSESDKQAIKYAEDHNKFDLPAYIKVNEHYYKLHVWDSPTENSPEYLRRPKKVGTFSYQVAWGPNEYNPTGNLRKFDYTNKLRHLDIPALITSGTNDICTPLVAKTMYDNIPNSQWYLFDGTRHTSFIERPDEYHKLLSSWLNEYD